MENVRSLADKMNELGAVRRILSVSLTALCSALRLYGQTETADRAVTVKEEG